MIFCQPPITYLPALNQRLEYGQDLCEELGRGCMETRRLGVLKTRYGFDIWV